MGGGGIALLLSFPRRRKSKNTGVYDKCSTAMTVFMDGRLRGHDG
jgi:hypothetical protein